MPMLSREVGEFRAQCDRMSLCAFCKQATMQRHRPAGVQLRCVVSCLLLCQWMCVLLCFVDVCVVVLCGCVCCCALWMCVLLLCFVDVCVVVLVRTYRTTV